MPRLLSGDICLGSEEAAGADIEQVLSLYGIYADSNGSKMQF